MAKLVVLSEGYKGKTHELKEERISIGRIEDNTFQIPEPSVSSHHCEVLLKGDEVVVKDLDSTNGTFIDGEQIEEAALKPGQVLRLGLLEIRLENGEKAHDDKKVQTTARAKPQGVKLNELEKGGQPVAFEANSPFKKKSNKINKVFVGVGIALGIIVVLLLAYALFSG
ncbi:MAG: FHA domain-containing protein [Verrucomicrobia bacterium]|nr:FHA domain-containing protein [Verrucomicrobiota bacterium]